MNVKLNESKMYRNLLILMIPIFFISCLDHKNRNKKTDENVITIDVSKATSMDFPDLFKEVEIRPLQTEKESLFGRINKVVYNNGEIYILDRMQKAILIFDSQGAYKRKLFNPGRGPGQYTDISDFVINQYTNNIEFLDGRNLFIYDNQGNFIESTKVTNDSILAVNYLQPINSDTIFFNVHHRDNKYYFYSRKNKRIIHEKSFLEEWKYDKVPYGYEFPMYTFNNELTLLVKFLDKTFTIKGTDFVLKNEWDFGDNTFNVDDPSIVNLLKNNELEKIGQNFDPYLDKYIIANRHYIENDDFIYRDFYFNKRFITLIYNKQNRNYLLLDGDLSTLLYNSSIFFDDNGKLYALVDPLDFELINKELLTEENRKILNGVDISDNPVIIRLSFKDNLLE